MSAVYRDGIITVATALFITSSSIGIDRGMKRLSDLNMVLMALLLLFVFFAGATLFVADFFIDTMGKYFSSLISTSFWTDPFRESNGWNEGDVHSWKVWTRLHPIEEYTEFYPRFCSEFGFESCPGWETILSFTEPEDRDLFSDVMVSHQKHVNGNNRLTEYLSQYYPEPSSFDRLCYTTQLMQAYAIRTAVEHYRRNRGRCMGALYWQLNDCWPVLSWSSVDYSGTPKALHYAAEQFYAPVLLSVKQTEGKTEFFVCNETRESFDGIVRVMWKTNSFKCLKTVEFACRISPYSSQMVGESDDADWIEKRKQQIFCTCSLLDGNGRIISESTGKYVRPKDYQYEDPQLHAVVHRIADGFSVAVSAKKYAANVFVSVEGAKGVQVDKQFFDLTSEKPEHIAITFPEHSRWDEKALAGHPEYEKYISPREA